MAKTARGRGGVNRFLVCGAALHWASVLFSCVSIEGELSIARSGFSEASFVHVFIIGMLSVFASLLSASFGSGRLRKVVASIVAASGIGLVLLSVSFSSSSFLPTEQFWVIPTLLRGVNSAGLVLLWGFAFASLDKQVAGKTVIVTALCAVLMYYGMIALFEFFQLESGMLLIGIARTTSAVFLLRGGAVKFSNVSRTPVTGTRASLTIFYVSRVVLGIFIGLLENLSETNYSQTSLALVVIGAAFVCGLLVAQARSEDGLYRSLPLAPLVLTGLLFLPFFIGGPNSASAVSMAIVWLLWIVLSSFQLSELKDSLGMSEASLCFTEKAVLTLAWAGTYLVVGSLADFSADAHAAALLSIALVYIVVVYASHIILRMASTRSEIEMAQTLAASREEHMANLYDEIAERYALTKRERQVMEMLAQGYTRTYIKDELVISDGTARAHIAHVYQKLGVHRKDDLLQLVNEEDSPFR